MRVNWFVLAQSRLRMPVAKFFKKEGVSSYEEAVQALKRVGLPFGSREEMAEFLPSASDQSNSHSSTHSPADPSDLHGNKKVQSRSKKKKKASSPAEEAADAITASTPVKSPQEKKAKKSTRKRKSS
jgi:hypothetical protein